QRARAREGGTHPHAPTPQHSPSCPDGERSTKRDETPAGRGAGRDARYCTRRSGEAQAHAGSAKEEGRGGELVGQKVHPGGLRVGVIHDWKSNWYTSNKDFAAALL